MWHWKTLKMSKSATTPGWKLARQLESQVNYYLYSAVNRLTTKFQSFTTRHKVCFVQLYLIKFKYASFVFPHILDVYLDIAADDCKAQFRGLRTQFGTKLKTPASGSKGGKTSQWKFFSSLMFLKNIMEPAR